MIMRRFIIINDHAATGSAIVFLIYHCLLAKVNVQAGYFAGLVGWGSSVRH